MNIGYACITIGVPGTELCTCTLKNAQEERLRELIRNNLTALDKMIDYNGRSHIRLFRISSEIIPFGSHPVNRMNWSREFEEELGHIGKRIKDLAIRVSMHPGQYTVLNSPKPEVVENGVRDLEYHARVLESLGTDDSSKIVLHIGGTYMDKAEASSRFAENFRKLPEDIRKRVVLENDDRNYNISEVLELGIRLESPVIFDNLHNAVNPADPAISERQWVQACASTWKSRDGRQKLHYSQQQASGRPGAHSDTIRTEDFLPFYSAIRDLDTDIMLEVKDKNLSAVKCILCTEKNLKVKELEIEWDRYKYAVLSKSGAVCSQIQTLLEDKEKLSAVNFYALVDKALTMPEDRDSEKNAALQIWDYFDNSVLEKEKKKFEELLSRYLKGETRLEQVKKNLLQLACKYGCTRLLNSYYFLV